MLTALDWGNEWIIAERPKIQREALKIVIAELLIREGQNEMLKPSRSDFVDRAGV